MKFKIGESVILNGELYEVEHITRIQNKENTIVLYDIRNDKGLIREVIEQDLEVSRHKEFYYNGRTIYLSETESVIAEVLDGLGLDSYIRLARDKR